MGLQDGGVVAVKVQGVILQEGSASGQSLAHEPCGAAECGALPVALGTESVAVAHEALAGQAGNLVESAAGGLHVHVAQVVKVGGECLGAIGLQQGTQREFGLGGVPDSAIALAGLVLERIGHRILLEVDVLDERGDVLVLHLVEKAHHLGEGAVVHMVAQHLFGGHLVAIGNGHIVHLVAEAENEAVLCVGPSGTHALPHGNVVLCLLVLPVAHHRLAGLAHTGEDVGILAVAMGTLVEVHEVHVDGVVGNLLVVLCVQMEQGLAQDLQAVNPHLGRGEGVHPGDDADTALVRIGCGHHLGHLMGVVGGALVDHLHGQPARLVEAFHHFLGMAVHLHYGITAIQELCARYKPHFELFKCFQHSFRVFDCLTILNG